MGNKILSRRNFLTQIPSILIPAVLLPLSCGKEEDSVTGGNNSDRESNLNPEIIKIESAYRSWTNKLIAQDYEGALAFCVPGGNAYNATHLHKEFWDQGWQHYHRIDYIEGMLDQEMLSNNSGEARGNLTYYQYHPSQGFSDKKNGFYSGVVKINGQWKIDGINSNLRQDWWRS